MVDGTKEEGITVLYADTGFKAHSHFVFVVYLLILFVYFFTFFFIFEIFAKFVNRNARRDGGGRRRLSTEVKTK